MWQYITTISVIRKLSKVLGQPELKNKILPQEKKSDPRAQGTGHLRNEGEGGNEQIWDGRKAR